MRRLASIFICALITAHVMLPGVAINGDDFPLPPERIQDFKYQPHADRASHPKVGAFMDSGHPSSTFGKSYQEEPYYGVRCENPFGYGRRHPDYDHTYGDIDVVPAYDRRRDAPFSGKNQGENPRIPLFKARMQAYINGRANRNVYGDVQGHQITGSVHSEEHGPTEDYHYTEGHPPLGGGYQHGSNFQGDLQGSVEDNQDGGKIHGPPKDSPRNYQHFGDVVGPVEPDVPNYHYSYIHRGQIGNHIPDDYHKFEYKVLDFPIGYQHIDHGHNNVEVSYPAGVAPSYNDMQKFRIPHSQMHSSGPLFGQSPPDYAEKSAQDHPEGQIVRPDSQADSYMRNGMENHIPRPEAGHGFKPYSGGVYGNVYQQNPASHFDVPTNKPKLNVPNGPANEEIDHNIEQEYAITFGPDGPKLRNNFDDHSKNLFDDSSDGLKVKSQYYKFIQNSIKKYNEKGQTKGDTHVEYKVKYNIKPIEIVPSKDHGYGQANAFNSPQKSTHDKSIKHDGGTNLVHEVAGGDEKKQYFTSMNLHPIPKGVNTYGHNHGSTGYKQDNSLSYGAPQVSGFLTSAELKHLQSWDNSPLFSSKVNNSGNQTNGSTKFDDAIRQLVPGAKERHYAIVGNGGLAVENNLDGAYSGGKVNVAVPETAGGPVQIAGVGNTGSLVNTGSNLNIGAFGNPNPDNAPSGIDKFQEKYKYERSNSKSVAVQSEPSYPPITAESVIPDQTFSHEVKDSGSSSEAPESQTETVSTSAYDAAFKEVTSGGGKASTPASPHGTAYQFGHVGHDGKSYVNVAVKGPKVQYSYGFSI